MIDGLHWLIRKSAHMMEYGILVTLWFTALTRNARLTRRRATWATGHLRYEASTTSDCSIRRP